MLSVSITLIFLILVFEFLWSVFCSIYGIIKGVYEVKFWN